MNQSSVGRDVSTSADRSFGGDLLPGVFSRLQIPALIVERGTTRIVGGNGLAEDHLAPHLKQDQDLSRVVLADLTTSTVEELEADLATGAPSGRLTLTLVGQDGRQTKRWPCQVVAVEPRDGERYWLLTIRSSPAANERFRRLTGELRRANDEARRERRISRKLKDDYQSLDEFAHHTAHDLRAPLRNISLCLKMIEEDSASSLSEESGHLLLLARSAADRLHLVVEESLEHAMAGHRAIDSVPVNLEEPVAMVLEENQPTLTEIGGTVTVLGSLGRVVGDRQLIGRMLDNLVGNAIKYRSANRPLALQIVGHVGADGGTTMLSVIDNGRGFSPDVAESLFDPFVRLKNAGPEGTGVGLATCRTICERHGWTIEALGKPDVGAEFRIRFAHRNRSG